MSHPVDIHVGQRIRTRRHVQGLTQQELSEAVGIKFQQIQKYETGMNRVSASRLFDIAQALNVPVSHFFEGLHARPKVADFRDADEVALIRAYRATDPEARAALLRVAQATAAPAAQPAS